MCQVIVCKSASKLLSILSNNNDCNFICLINNLSGFSLFFQLVYDKFIDITLVYSYYYLHWTLPISKCKYFCCVYHGAPAKHCILNNKNIIWNFIFVNCTYDFYLLLALTFTLTFTCIFTCIFTYAFS